MGTPSPLRWINNLFSPKSKQAIASGKVRSLASQQSWSDFVEAFNAMPYGGTSASLKVSAVFACNDRISKDISSLPFKTMRKTQRGYEVASDHDQYFVGRSPHPMYTKSTFFYVLNTNVNLYGDGFAKIVRQGGRPVAYELWDPRKVKHEIVDGRLYWIKKDGNNVEDVVADEDMIHVMWYTDDGIRGKSVLSFARDTVKLAMNSSKLSAELYENQMWSPGYISYKGELTKEQVEIIGENWAHNYMGRDNANTIPVLDQGSEFKHFGMSLQDAEYIQTKVESVRDIARFFGVPVSKLNVRDGNVSYNSLEQENIAYVQDTIQPRVVAIEEEFERKALRPNEWEQVRFKFNLSSRLRGDSAARSSFYQMALTTGLLSINDVLALEDMNTIGAEGDERYINGANVPLSQLYDKELDDSISMMISKQLKKDAAKVQ